MFSDGNTLIHFLLTTTRTGLQQKCGGVEADQVRSGPEGFWSSDPKVCVVCTCWYLELFFLHCNLSAWVAVWLVSHHRGLWVGVSSSLEPGDMQHLLNQVEDLLVSVLYPGPSSPFHYSIKWSPKRFNRPNTSCLGTCWEILTTEWNFNTRGVKSKDFWMESGVTTEYEH